MGEALKGKTILVTGGGSGIGRATAQLFARNGASVVVTDMVEEAAQSCAQEIVAAGGTAVARRVNIAIEDEVAAAIDFVCATYGRLDGAFNNAAMVGRSKRVHELTAQEWAACHGVNMAGTFYCMKYEIAAMLKSGGGSIVNTASAAGLVAVPLSVEYTASKHGVIGLTRASAIDYARDKIRVNAIAPGTVRTPMLEEALAGNPQLEAFAIGQHPIGRFGEPIEQGEAAMWLLSDAASFVTGAVLSVDGGYTAL